MNDRDTARLRDLAGKYADIALGDTMAARREKWRLHNGLHEKTYPFHIEDNGTFFRDLTPPVECEEPMCRNLEGRLIRALTEYEKIDDDRIIPDRFLISPAARVSNLCDELVLTHADDGRGGSLGYKSNKPIADIDADLHKLTRRTITPTPERTEKAAELAREVFKGLMPVAVGKAGSFYSDGITNKAVHLMGMQELYLQMAMDPDAVHRFFKFIGDDVMALGKWEEDNNILTINNDGNQGYCSGSSYFSDQTPGREIKNGEPVLATDTWGYLESQESASVSPDMFNEFLMPHFLKAASKFALIKFGCCEPVHDFMPHLQKLNGLRKVTVTPWCDLEKLAAGCNKDVIWSRKPVPLKLCSDTFDPGEFKAHLQETLTVGEGYFIEFIFRDTTRLTADMQPRVTQACEIVRELTGHPEGRKRETSTV